jgi:hypothetical protein
MGHYKANLRDIEFNLFDVFGGSTTFGSADFPDVDVETARDVLAQMEKLAENELAESFVEADRNPPVFDPTTSTAPLPEAFKRSYKAYVDTEFWRLGLPVGMEGTAAPASLVWAMGELVLGANPAIWMYATTAPFARVLWNVGTEEQRKVARLMVDNDWGATMVLTEPDAGSDVGAGRTRAVRAAGRHLAHRGRQALHHLGRARPVRQHHPPGAGPPRGRGPRHQGPVAVHRAEVRVRLGHRRDRRAQRRLRHQRRAQDGPEGLQHLRADLRREAPGQGLAGRRGAQRHRADVPGHRDGPDDGRHQGHRHPVHRLPQRARVRQEPGAGRGPGRDRPTRPPRGSPSPTTPTCAAS